MGDVDGADRTSRRGQQRRRCLCGQLNDKNGDNVQCVRTPDGRE